MSRFYSSIAFSLLFIVGYTSHAQQDPVFSQYMFTPMVINPSYAGINDMMSITATSRAQWTNIEGAPKTYGLNAHSSLPINNMGAGLTAVLDRFGINSNTEVNLAGSYQIKNGDNRLAFGLQGGYVSYRMNYQKLNLKDKDDKNFELDKDKGLIPISINKPNLGFGVMYNTPKYFVSVSSPRLLDVNSKIGNSDTTVFRYRRHIYAYGGLVMDLGNVKFKPSTLIKFMEGAPLAFDINGSVLLNESIWVGGSYRSNVAFQKRSGSAVAMCQIQATNELKIGYSFDFPLNSDLRAAGGYWGFSTHEIMVNLNLAVFGIQAVQTTYY